jgi:hypothetical protein
MSGILDTYYMALGTLKSSGGGIPTDYIARYDFDNGSAADSSGNAFNGTINGTNILPTTNRFGIADKALSFNIAAKDSWITTPYIPNNNVYTVSVWIKKSVDITLISFMSLWGGQEFLINYPATDRLTLYTGSVYFDPTLNIDDRWVHYLFTYDGDIATLYIDGDFFDSAYVSMSPNYLGLTIGRSRQGPVFYYKGLIDDIRIYDRVVTTEEITALKDEI